MENIGDISTIPIIEKQPVILGNQNTGTMSSTTPALYVLVKQSTGKPDQRTLLSNQDNSSLLSSAAKPLKSKAKTYLPADCASGNITVMLDNNNMWNEFYHRSTEMILTKQGRRMFPYCRYWITGLDSNLKYILVMDISPVDNFRYKWNGHSWEPSGKAEPHVLGRVFIHPESPSTGHYWMRQPVSFYKLKLTNNTLDQEGHIILHSMHRYLPRLHLVPAEKATEVIQLNGPDVCTFTFPQTEFFAVTAYQNIQITQLKIDYNPFAKGFREDGLSSRLQRDVKQNGSSEREGNSSPTNHRHPPEGNILDPSHRELDPPTSGICDPDLEKESLSPYHDFLHFAETDVHAGDNQEIKEEASESPIYSPCQKMPHVTSQLTPEGGMSVSIKEEPLDNYEYKPLTCMEGVNVKEEETNNIAEEYSNSGSSILEQQMEKYSEIDKLDIEFHKEQQINQLGVAKAKMLKLDSGKMPVVYLEPCTITRNAVKVPSRSQVLLTTSKNEKSPLSHSLDSFSADFENKGISSPFAAKETEITVDKMVSENTAPQIPSERDVLGRNTETCSRLGTTEKGSSCDLKVTTTSSPSLAKVISDDQKTNMLKTHISGKSVDGNKNVGVSCPKKRGRPRKSKLPEAGRSPKCIAKSGITNNYASLGTGSSHLDVNPDLEDVDGMLFVSFVSKEALDTHTFDRAEEKELQNTQNNSLATCNPCTDSDGQRIQQLEKELLEDLKSFKYKQVIHPSLQEVGLKLNFVDPTMSIDLKYLGVQLPLSYSEEYTSWKNEATNSNSADAGLHFISRTGKTNDITKIKGWRGKIHNSSKNEGNLLEGLLKNRSAFCSDKLDEYLENEGKLMETSIRLSPSTSSSPVVYQLPTKSTSYVRTLDSVLKKQSTATNLSSYTPKPLGLPSISKKKKEKVKNKKQTVSKGKEKSSQKVTVGLSVAKKHKQKLISEEKVSKSQAIDQTNAEKDASMMSGTEENLQSKQITVRQVQQQQGSRLSTLSKTQLKLLDLENCALWDGKPRTYITEERAELSLTILLTAQASLKNKPIHKIIKKKAPPCNNDFCRLGCICSSLAVEKRQPTHCRKPDCMFGCTCLKRKVVLVKHKKIQEKPLHGKHKLYHERKQQTDVIAKDEQEKMKPKDKKKKKKVEYTICDTQPEKPVKNFPLWIKKDGEMDPEPIYIPTPSDVEATKTASSTIPEIISTDDKPTATETISLVNGVKPLRVYTPRPNPVIREEDKDPVYLYFESMMTCARVRIYERKVREKGQQEKCPWNCEKHIEKEHDADPQPLKIEEDKDPGEKSWWFSCSAGDPSTSYVHRITPDGKNKLIEIISDCNWEEDRNEILNILSQHIKNKMPKSLKVGHFLIELESESKTWDEKHTPIYSSRVKISMPPCRNKNQTPPVPVESPDAGLSPCKRTEKLTFTPPEKLQEQRSKGLPFYAGLSSAGKLIANTCKYDLNPSDLIQVNGKNSPEAKLLLGQMGALHPASHLAAYLTGRLQSTMFDLSTMILKIGPNNKLAASESLSTEVSTSETSKTPFSSDTTSVSTTRVSTQRQIAPRPLFDGMTSQLTSLNTAEGLQKKASETGSSQSLTVPQKCNINSVLLSAGSTTIATTADATSVASLPVTVFSPLQNNSTTHPSDIVFTNTVGKQEINTSLPTDAMEITKSVTSMPFAQSSTPDSTSTAVIPLTVTSPTSSVSCVHPAGLSGIQKSPLSNQKQGATSPPGLPHGAEYRMGTRFILIPVQQCSSTLRPSQNMQVASGKRIVLQPLRHPGAVNLYRHPNGQIIQLVPLHQLQTSGAQSSLQPIMLRNPGSMVGIRSPGPSKLPETFVCQASAVPSMTSTTTSSILSTSPSVFSELSTAENTSVLSGTSSTTTAVLSQTPTTESSLILSMSSNALSVSPSAEASSLLSMASTTDIPLLPVTSSTTLVPCTAAVSSSLPYSMPVSPTNKSPSLFTVSPNGTNSLLPLSPSSILMSSVIEGTSAPSESPIANWTLQDIRTTTVPSASVTQVAPVNSSDPLSPVGTLTLRISPSEIKINSDQTSSQSKITCNTSGLQSNIDNLISLQSGSFALLQFPGQKNDSSSIAKKVASLEIRISHKKNELSANKLEENSVCSQTVEITDSVISTLKDNKLPLHNPNFHSEEITCKRNISEIIEKDAEILKKLPGIALMLQANIQSDHSYTSEKCEEDGALSIKKINQDKDAEHPLDKVSYSNEKCNEVAVLAHNTLQERSMQNPITESKKAEQKPLDTKAGLIIEQSSWKPVQQRKPLNNTEKLQAKTKLLDPWKNEDPELPRQNRKEKCDFVTKEKDREKVSEKAKSTIGKNKNNDLENEYLDNAHEDLYEKNTDFQSNRNSSSYEKSIKDIQEDNQNKKDEHKSDRTWDKLSRPSLVEQNKINVDADQLVEKLTKSTKQNTWKTKCHRKKSSPLIDTTQDDTEKDEKTEESSNEMIDETFEYQSEDTIKVGIFNGSDSSEAEENVDIETVQEFSEKVNLARLKATAAHALLSKQLHLVRNHSNKMTSKRHKQSEFSNKKLKNEEQAFANYRQTHTANERRRRKEMRVLFEKLKAALGLQAFPKVSKCFILKQALEEIQGLTDQADKLTGQKDLLLHTQDTLVRKVSALSGKTQEVVLKKLEYIYAKQKAVAAQKGKQNEQTEPAKMIETTETASPSVENDPTSVLGEVKPVVLSNQRTKPLILSRKGNHVTGDLPSSITLTNAKLLVTTNGQVLAFRSSSMPRQVTALSSTLLQAKVKSETEGNDEKELSALAENEDSFLMPRIVNVTSLATEEETNLNLDANKEPYITLNTDSRASELSLQVLSQETSNHTCKEKETSEKEKSVTETTQDLLQEKYSFPQILNVSSLKGCPETFGTKLCFEELTGSQTWAKEVDGGGKDYQKSKNSSLQKLQINKTKDSGSEMELQQVPSVIHEPTLDTTSSIDIEENDDTDETLTSLLNEIAFLNQQLSDDASDIPELNNPLSSSFSLADTESHQESNSASSSTFQFGTVSENFKDLSMIQDNGDSITPLLLHLDVDDFPVGNRNAGEVSSESALKIMLDSEVKDRNSNLLKINGSGKNMASSAKTRSVSPPILHMKTNLEAGTSDMSWRPMPKLAPLGLKTANHSLDSEGQSTKVMPALAPVASKEKKLAQSDINPSQDSKATNTKATAVTKSN